MTTRVLLADQAEARFYDIDPAGSTLRCVSLMSCPNARLHDRDLTSGEKTPRRHEATTFAHHVVQALESGRNAHEFNHLVLIAGPRFMGTLRTAIPKPLAELVTLEIVKDLMHGGEEAVRAHLPATVLRAKTRLSA